MLSIYLISIYLSLHISICTISPLYIILPIYSSTIHLSVYLSIYRSVVFSPPLEHLLSLIYAFFLILISGILLLLGFSLLYFSVFHYWPSQVTSNLPFMVFSLFYFPFHILSLPLPLSLPLSLSLPLILSPSPSLSLSISITLCLAIYPSLSLFLLLPLSIHIPLSLAFPHIIVHTECLCGPFCLDFVCPLLSITVFSYHCQHPYVEVCPAFIASTFKPL